MSAAVVVADNVDKTTTTTSVSNYDNDKKRYDYNNNNSDSNNDDNDSIQRRQEARKSCCRKETARCCDHFRCESLTECVEASKAGYIAADDNIVNLSSFMFSCWALEDAWFVQQKNAYGCSTSPEVINFGTNRKRIYMQLLSNDQHIAPILPNFKDGAGFLLWSAISPLLWQKFEDAP